MNDTTPEVKADEERCARCDGKIVIGKRAAAILKSTGVPVDSLEYISDRDITDADIAAIKRNGELFGWAERIKERRGSLDEPSSEQTAPVVPDEVCSVDECGDGFGPCPVHAAPSAAPVEREPEPSVRFVRFKDPVTGEHLYRESSDSEPPPETARQRAHRLLDELIEKRIVVERGERKASYPFDAADCDDAVQTAAREEIRNGKAE